MTQLVENNTWVSRLIDTSAAGEFAPNRTPHAGGFDFENRVSEGIMLTLHTEA